MFSVQEKQVRSFRCKVPVRWQRQNCLYRMALFVVAQARKRTRRLFERYIVCGPLGKTVNITTHTSSFFQSPKVSEWSDNRSPAWEWPAWFWQSPYLHNRSCVHRTLRFIPSQNQWHCRPNQQFAVLPWSHLLQWQPGTPVTSRRFCEQGESMSAIRKTSRLGRNGK